MHDPDLWEIILLCASYQHLQSCKVEKVMQCSVHHAFSVRSRTSKIRFSATANLSFERTTVRPSSAAALRTIGGSIRAYFLVRIWILHSRFLFCQSRVSRVDRFGKTVWPDTPLAKHTLAVQHLQGDSSALNTASIWNGKHEPEYTEASLPLPAYT